MAVMIAVVLRVMVAPSSPARPRLRDGDGDVPLLAASTKAPCSSQAEQLMAVLVPVLWIVECWRLDIQCGHLDIWQTEQPASLRRLSTLRTRMCLLRMNVTAVL